jgi:iron complex transport system substrate-binding protein
LKRAVVKKNSGMIVAGLVTMAVLVSLGIGGGGEREAPETGASMERIVSLSPAITETLFAIGAGERVIGRSDYCRYPEEVRGLPAGGTALTPSLESLVRMRPTHLVAERSSSVPASMLGEIAPTTQLPWLTLEEITASVRTLGALTGTTERAEEVAMTLESSLSQDAPEDAPGVLVLIGMGGIDSTTFWFIRPDSLHGRGMEAAGARNAIEGKISAAPSISVEELISLDPDVIVAMIADVSQFETQKKAYREALARLPMLRTVKEDTIGFLKGPALFTTGPRIVGFVDALRNELERLGVLGQRT